MKSFIQFLMEEMVDFYHRTDPTSALNIQKNGVNASGLSVWLEPKRATDYEGYESNGFVSKGSPTITGKVSTRQLIPDMEWNREAYNDMFGEIARQQRENPNYRTPSLRRNSQLPRGFADALPGSPLNTHSNVQFNIPGRIYNRETGKTEHGWEPRFSADGKIFYQAHEINLGNSSLKPYIHTLSQTRVGPQGTEILQVDKPIPWGGPTNQSKYGYKERSDLDVLITKGDRTKITNKFLKGYEFPYPPSWKPPERKAFRTTSNVEVSPKMSFSDKATGVNSYFNLDNKTGDAYWGYQVPDGKGGHTDIPPEGLSPEAKSGISRAARDQMTRYRKANPGTNITSQYNPGAQGEANWKFWQGEDAKLKATNPEITGSFTRETPTTGSGISKGLAGFGAAALGGVVSGALGAGTNAAAAAYQHRTTDEKMPMEKSMQSDMGLMWDKVPGESGELQGNPAGFKAARDREKKTGVPYPTYHDWSN